MEERLQKIIARAGVASRREAERLIDVGRVTVNGKVVREHGMKVDARIDEVRVDTVLIPLEASVGDDQRTYLLLNKPKGVLCTVKDTHGRRTVLDLCPPFQGKRLYPVGRLDEESEGLVLLTNDGDLTERITHPRYRVPKVYEVRVKGKLLPETARAFEAGIWLSDGRTGRSRVRIAKMGLKVSHAHVTLTEGKNREIRRAFAKLGHAVLSLRRIQIGPIVSRGLKAGQYRPLDQEEVEALRAAGAGTRDGRPLRRSSSGSGRTRKPAAGGRGHKPAAGGRGQKPTAGGRGKKSTTGPGSHQKAARKRGAKRPVRRGDAPRGRGGKQSR